MKTEIKALAVKLAECILACNECHEACLHEKMVEMMAGCIRADKDCAAVCGATLQLLHTGSRPMKRALELCVASCEACVAECAKHDNEHCRRCAAVCRQCAEACRDFSAGV